MWLLQAVVGMRQDFLGCVRLAEKQQDAEAHLGRGISPIISVPQVEDSLRSGLGRDWLQFRGSLVLELSQIINRG